MHSPRHIKLLRTAVLMLAPLLAACSADGPVAPEPEEVPDGYLRVQVSVAGSGSSRANPSPGENGDGLEAGIRNENTIYDVCVFIYADQGAGLDSQPATPFAFKGYVSTLTADQTGNLYAVYPLRDYTPAENHRAVVVANAGDISTRVSTLGELRTRLVDEPWQPGANIAAADRCVMASAYNGAKKGNNDGHIQLVNSSTGSAERPNFYTEVAIERVAARIDLMANKSLNIDPAQARGLHYTVKKSAASLTLTHVVPVNLMGSPSWTLKHVTDGTDTGSLLVCGDETVTATGTPSNYVIAPSTLLKSEDVSDATLKDWYGDTRASWLAENYRSVFAGTGALSGFLPYAVSQTEGDCDRILTIAYSHENTQTEAAHTERFITGLLFRAEYRPGVIFTKADLTETLATSSEARSFWLVRPSDQSMEENDCVYFASAEAAGAYVSAHPELRATITAYPDGICYYNMWIRHALDNSIADPDAVHETHPMEYGIVRNNIYRIGLSFTGCGAPEPEFTNPLNIQSRIFVRHWNFRPQPEILM